MNSGFPTFIRWTGILAVSASLTTGCEKKADAISQADR